MSKEWRIAQRLFCCLTLFPIHSVLWTSDFISSKAGFSVKFKQETSSYRVLGVYVMPGETVTLTMADNVQGSRFAVKSTAGTAKKNSDKSWQWQAPAKNGLYPLTISRQSPRDSILLNIFVLMPYENLNGETLNSYRIGKYPVQELKKSPTYQLPRGFIEVTEETQETLIAPHFRLGQFLCKQISNYPKYLILSERLLLLLELILEKTNEAGYRCDTFHIMSGYRTPYYNQSIGNVRYSCHLYGNAVDFFIDVDPEDEIMDDLNQDGQSDIKDATIIHDLIQQMSEKSWFQPFLGGLARYEKASSHGPFVHVDVRGYQACWGR